MRLHRRRRLFSSISHARNVKKFATQDSWRAAEGCSWTRGSRRGFAIVRAAGTPFNWTDRVDSILNEPLCPVTYAGDKSNNLTERSKGAYRPRERRERGRGKQEWREKGKGKEKGRRKERKRDLESM